MSAPRYIPSRPESISRLAALAANLALVALLLLLYRPVYTYLQIIFTRQEFRTNQIVLVAVIALLALQLRGQKLNFRPWALPQMYLPALAVILSASALFLITERFLDINTLSASFFGLAAYGLLGLWLSPHRWRQGLPAALLLIGVLPFGDHMQTFIGYPVRLATAAIVRDGFSALGVSSIGVDTILVFENGVSQVDLPCSGVKSLWAGGLFLLAATWIDRRQINLHWLLAALAFSALLLAANLARVGVLVGVGEVAGWRLAAEMLHVPLGVLGFTAACGGGVLLLRWAGKTRPRPAGADRPHETSGGQPILPEDAKNSPGFSDSEGNSYEHIDRPTRASVVSLRLRTFGPPSVRAIRPAWSRGPFGPLEIGLRPISRAPSGHSRPTPGCATEMRTQPPDAVQSKMTFHVSRRPSAGLPPRPAWLAPLLGGVLLGLSLLYVPRPAAAETHPATPWIFPDSLQIEPWPLTGAEMEWLGSTGALSGDRWRFTWQEISGTMLFVTGNSWRAQHRPERCFEVYGLAVLDSRPYLASPDFPLQLLTLGDGKGRELYSAAYWFQSPGQITSDYGARIWSDLAPERDSWVLVTVLFEDIYEPDEPAPAGFYSTLRQSVAISLGQGAP